jgi:hypothetical protein
MGYSLGGKPVMGSDVVERVKRESRSRGASFKETLNDLLRSALLHLESSPQRRPLNIRAAAMGYRAGRITTVSSLCLNMGRARGTDDILDANLLLYAYNLDAPQQRAASGWLTEVVENGETIGLPWVTIWAFLRISTNGRIWENPLPAKQALALYTNGSHIQPSCCFVQGRGTCRFCNSC